MKSIKKYICVAGIALLALSCNDFKDLNYDPTTISDPSQLKAEYSFNAAVMKAHQNPETAERTFILTWKALGRLQSEGYSAAIGNASDDYQKIYWDRVAEALSSIQAAKKTASDQLATGKLSTNETAQVSNILQISRIWHVYLLSEIADMFGAIPDPENRMINDFYLNYIGLQDAYPYFLDELADASSNLNLNIKPTGDSESFDIIYKFNATKWKKAANSLRMRFAIRTSEVDNANAKIHFESAIKEGYITDLEDNFGIQEKGDYNTYQELSAVMSRQWNMQLLSSTLNNLMTGLGGVQSSDQLGVAYQSYIKPVDYIGERYADYWPTTTDNPTAPYWLDGLPNKIDPRAYKLFALPGDFDNPEFAKFPTYSEPSWAQTQRNLVRKDGDKEVIVKSIEAKLTWNAATIGSYGDMGSLNQVIRYSATNPRLANKFRSGTMVRIIFASWESHFLMAEAALKGWTITGTAKEAYEKGITQSFTYNEVDPEHLATYLASDNYNNVGTSVSWSHTTEPSASRVMKVKNGMTGEMSTVSVPYPVASKTRYGKALNDQLTKIITQKYIANTPWLGLESWSDHRRLGLPFFDSPVVEIPIPSMPAVSKTSYLEGQQKDFYTQRIRFPSSLSDNNSVGYDIAVKSLGTGGDNVFTPLWWAKQK